MQHEAEFMGEPRQHRVQLREKAGQIKKNNYLERNRRSELETEAETETATEFHTAIHIFGLLLLLLLLLLWPIPRATFAWETFALDIAHTMGGPELGCSHLMAFFFVGVGIIIRIKPTSSGSTSRCSHFFCMLFHPLHRKALCILSQPKSSLSIPR